MGHIECVCGEGLAGEAAPPASDEGRRAKEADAVIMMSFQYVMLLHVKRILDY